ncbi:phospholipase-like protein [Tanacetum coccineum]
MKNHESRPTGSTPLLEANVSGNTSGHKKCQDKGKIIKNDGGEKAKGAIKNGCYRCGSVNHWARACRTPKQLVEFYQRSQKNKGKGVEVNFAYHDEKNDNFDIDSFDIIGVIEDEEMFAKLSDDDAICFCLLLAAKVIFMGRLLTFKVDDTLFRLVENLEAWNSFPWGEHLWCHLYDEIKNLKQRHSDEHYYGLKKDRNYVPIYMLSGFVLAFQVLAHERNDRQPKLQFTDAFRYEDISQDYILEEELRLCLEDEEMLRCEHEKIIFEENRFRLDEVNRLRLEEENMLQLEEQKKIKRKEFMNSSHGKSILAKLAPAKRNQLGSSSKKINSKVSWVKIKKYRQHVNDPCTGKLLKNVKPWVEDISRVLHCMDTVWLSDDIERFLGQPGQVKCKFPWNDDYTVDRNFWLKLVCLDPARKGWLTEELLLQKGLPLFYANKKRYTTPWSEVDQERHEQIFELQSLVGSNVAAESVRLAHGLSLDVDDPVDVALAYREKMVQFF